MSLRLVPKARLKCSGVPPAAKPSAGPVLPEGEVPYATGEAALRDGWMLLQSAQLIAPAEGDELRNSYMHYEFVFERRVSI